MRIQKLCQAWSSDDEGLVVVVRLPASVTPGEGSLNKFIASLAYRRIQYQGILLAGLCSCKFCISSLVDGQGMSIVPQESIEHRLGSSVSPVGKGLRRASAVVQSLLRTLVINGELRLASSH